MDPALRTAIEERIKVGQDKVEIVSQLQSAGYTEAEAADFYEQVASEDSPNTTKSADSTSSDIATPTDTPAAADGTAAVSADSSESSAAAAPTSVEDTAPATGSQPSLALVAVVVAILVVILGAVAFFVYDLPSLLF